MFNDYYLKFDGEEEAKTFFHAYLDEDGNWQDNASATFEEVDEDGNPYTITKTASFDIIGEYYRPTGNILTDEDGFEYPETELIPGFFLNVRAREAIEGLEVYDTHPITPC